MIKKKIKKYIKNTIEQMASGSYNYISNYIFIKKINLKIINNKLEIYITLKIDRNGKKIIDNSSKKLQKNELNQLCTKNNLHFFSFKTYILLWSFVFIIINLNIYFDIIYYNEFRK